MPIICILLFQVGQYAYDPYSYGDRYEDSDSMIAEYGKTKESGQYQGHQQHYANQQSHSHQQSNHQTNPRTFHPFSDNEGHAGNGREGNGRDDDDNGDGGEGVVMMMRKRVKPRGPSAGEQG